MKIVSDFFLSVQTSIPGVFYIVPVAMGVFITIRHIHIKYFKGEKINITDRRN